MANEKTRPSWLRSKPRHHEADESTMLAGKARTRQVIALAGVLASLLAGTLTTGCHHVKYRAKQKTLHAFSVKPGWIEFSTGREFKDGDTLTVYRGDLITISNATNETINVCLCGNMFENPAMQIVPHGRVQRKVQSEEGTLSSIEVNRSLKPCPDNCDEGSPVFRTDAGGPKFKVGPDD